MSRVLALSLFRFRDFCFQDCLALRNQSIWSAELTAEELDYCHWLGLTPSMDPGNRSSEVEAELKARLSQLDGLPDRSLSDYRAEGYLGEAIYAALIRSSYGSDRADYFPTRSELGFYFELEELRAESALWDDQYLHNCQKFFIEELTPEELVDRVFARLEENGLTTLGIRERWEVELRGVAFLVGEEQQTLLPLVQLFAGLVGNSPKLDGLKRLVSSESWSRETVEHWYSGLADKSRADLLEYLGPSMADQMVDILYACGPTFLSWRLERAA